MTSGNDNRPNAPKRTGPIRPQASAAGGVFIALGTITGTIFGGFVFGQPSIGFVVGLIVGVAAAVVVALTDGPRG